MIGRIVPAGWPAHHRAGVLVLAAGFFAGLGMAFAEGGLVAWIPCAALFWALAAASVSALAAGEYAAPAERSVQRLMAAAIFGVTILVLWQMIVVGFEVPTVLLPPPSMIGARIATSLPVLGQDVVQTFLRGAVVGWIIGCGAAVGVALLIDRSPFLTRGLLPVGNLAAALPIVGVAPIMVMWYGADWHSKAAMVVVMVFFPMLVNTVEGLKAAERMQMDLMRTYAAGYWATMFKLRLPAAAPFIFNGLKICSTLALIGAIVAEFFGSPTVGMGFRISTEAGRMNVDMVWAEIAAAAVVGSGFYGLMALAEKRATFWHPSQRG